MARTTTCDECDGTGTFTKGTTPADCPWCDATGLVEVTYVVRGHGFNGDHNWSELYNVTTSLKAARQVAENAMRNRGEHVLEDGTPTLLWMEITGPGIEESISLEADEAGAFTWHGEDDQKVEWRISKNEGVAVEAMLAPLPEGAEFRLSSAAGRAYRALYRKNAEGTWDQVAGTCEAPHVINMSADHLGFCVGAKAVREALAA